MADSNKYRISIGIIEELKRKKMNQTEIAEMFGISRQAVSYHKVRYSGSRTPREIVRDNFPWTVQKGLHQCSPYKRIMDHGEYMATGGKGMSKDKLSRLRSFYAKLREDNLVVEYDPTIPPTPGVAKLGGFAFRARLSQDGDLLIRVNEHTNLTDEGRMIWRFPPQDP
jgi:hypothetical protein